MEFFRIYDSNNNIDHTNIPDECLTCYSNCPTGITKVNNAVCGKRKRFKEVEETSSFYFCSAEPECIGSNKVFKTKANVVKGTKTLIQDYKTQLSLQLTKQNKRIFHNVISLNGHNIQELYALVSDKTLSQKVDQQRSIIRENIEKNIDDAVSMFLRIAKNNLAIQTNFNVFNKLAEPNPVLSFRKHKIKRVLLTVYHVFFQDFFDNNIQVIIGDSDAEVLVDFESISVAFYHILDNAAKYALRNSKLNITFRQFDESCLIIFDMDSIEIKDEEVNKLTQEGFKGENSKKLASKGDGLGMYIVDQLLKLTNGKLHINTHPRKHRQVKDGVVYCNNHIMVELRNT
jgi:Signal transduction histidine kinase